MQNDEILIVDDDAGLREALSDTLSLAGYRVSTAEHGREALVKLGKNNYPLVLSDVQMQPMDGMELLQAIRARDPLLPVLMMTAYGTIEKAVEAMRYGASDYLVKPFDASVLLELVSRYLNSTTTEADATDLVAADDNMQQLKQLASRVAASDATVLLCGESGVGKEVFARFIHQQSPRCQQPFVAINCAAIPENMLESILFGYEKGAFTGAHQSTPGKFELAQGGTLLLDEISEMDASLQAKLLRVLQEKEVERLGGRKTIPLDVRVLATTNRRLRDEVGAGRFREDLFYRLSVFPITIPPLRERIGDIIPIARKLLHKHGQAGDIDITPAAQQRLVSHTWPGNVRELDNVIQRAMIIKIARDIDVDDIHFESAANMPVHTESLEQAQASVLVSDLKDREQQLILEALKAGKGSRKYAAERLGISPRTLRYKLARMRDAGIAI